MKYIILQKVADSLVIIYGSILFYPVLTLSFA